MTQHLHAPQALAAGLHALPSTTRPFAATQAAWRFLANDRVTPQALAVPLRDAGRQAAHDSTASHLLLAHDWSFLSYPDHHAKTDRVPHSHPRALGYDSACALLIDAHTGDPLAPMELELTTTAGVLSTRADRATPLAHIDQVLDTMRASQSWGLEKPLVHVIDREADGLAQFRAWHAAGHLFLVRVNDRRRVRWRDSEPLLTEVAATLFDSGLAESADAPLGAGETLWVAQTEVGYDRPARVRVGATQRAVPGVSLTLRLVVSRVLAPDGSVAAEWLLVSNVGEEVSAAQVARWYALRWRIESWFKLLKSQGQQVESWQQESGGAVLKRLLVASMACVLAWRLARDTSEPGQRLAGLLGRLSGRQSKRGRPVSASMILAGLEKLLGVLALLEETTLEELRGLLGQRLPGLRGTG